jgi:hypothetical protein
MGCTVRGSNPGKGEGVFSTDIQAVSEAHPASYSMGTEFFLGGGGLAAGIEVNHSPPSCVLVKNEGSYTFTVPICLHSSICIC